MEEWGSAMRRGRDRVRAEGGRGSVEGLREQNRAGSTSDRSNESERKLERLGAMEFERARKLMCM